MPHYPRISRALAEDFAAYNRAIVDVATESGAFVVDMHRLLGGDKRWYSDFVPLQCCRLEALRRSTGR